MQAEADTPHRCTIQSTEAGRRGQPLLSDGRSVFGGDFVDVVDDEDFDGDFLWDELEAELLLHGGEDVGEVGVGIVGGGKFKGDVVGATQPGSVDDRTFDWTLEYVDKRLYRIVPESDLVASDHSMERCSFVWLKFGAAFCDDQRVSGDDLLFTMNGQVEALLQQIL